MKKAVLFDIQHASFVDGPGIRTTFFFKGCNLNCAWCHNPESLKKSVQLNIYKDRCIDCGKCTQACNNKSCVVCGECADVCPVSARKIIGEEWTLGNMVSEAEKDIPFYKKGGGITCSGGECMLQADFLQHFLKECKDKEIHTAVDTAGNVAWSEFEKIIPYTDLFLYDIKCISKELHKKYTGADNALILDNIHKLSDTGAKIWVRVPLIPEVNGNDNEMTLIADEIGRLKVLKAEILPYHSLGEGKRVASGYEKTSFTVPLAEMTAKYQTLVEKSIK